VLAVYDPATPVFSAPPSLLSPLSSSPIGMRAFRKSSRFPGFRFFPCQEEVHILFKVPVPESSVPPLEPGQGNVARFPPSNSSQTHSSCSFQCAAISSTVIETQCRPPEHPFFTCSDRVFLFSVGHAFVHPAVSAESRQAPPLQSCSQLLRILVAQALVFLPCFSNAQGGAFLIATTLIAIRHIPLNPKQEPFSARTVFTLTPLFHVLAAVKRFGRRTTLW